MGEETGIHPKVISYDHRCEETLLRRILKSFQIVKHLVAFRFIYQFVKIWKSKCRRRAKSFEGVASGRSSFLFAKENVATGSFGHQAKPFWKTATSWHYTLTDLWVAGGVDVKVRYEHCNKGNSASFQQENLVLSDILLVPAAMILDLSVNDSPCLGICRYK
jgi:hypothetical protein